MTTEKDLHPVRFTYRQVGFLKNAINQFFEYFEEDAAEFFETMEASEKGMAEEEKELSN